jgi:peptidoglycan hydrolase-like protein with peptidoglycan-binding domain
VQRRLNGLGFETKVNGKFDEKTRAVITRWQAARGYPKSGFLNKLQHKALLIEVVTIQVPTQGIIIRVVDIAAAEVETIAAVVEVRAVCSAA